MKKKLFAALLAGALLVTTSACGAPTVSNDPAPDDADAAADAGTPSGSGYEDCKVSIILKTLSSEYWGYVEAGIRDAEKDLGCTVELSGATSETAYDEQLGMIETTLTRADIQAVAVAPLQPDMAATMLKTATIPVLAVDTRIEGADNVLSFIGTDHETAAYEGAKKLCTQLTEELGRAVKVGMIQGVQGDTTNTARFTGFEKGAKEAGAEIVNMQYCNAMEDQARNCMDSLLSLYPNKGDLDVVFVCNDGCAQGAARAISEEGRGDEIRVCGYDGISSGVQAILDGTMTATVAQDPYNIGYQCVAALCKVAKGETVDKEIDTGSHLIDAANAGEYLNTLNSRLAG